MSPTPDKDISAWILDFLLRRPGSDSVVSRLLPDADDPHLKKRWLLRFIESEVSNGNICEKFLDALETIQAIDQKAGVSVREPMMSAYCAVAVDCTVKYLGIYSLCLGGKEKFFEEVKRIWTDRIGKLEQEKNELASYELNRWKDEIQKAVLDEDVAKLLAKMNTQHEALKAINAYLKDALPLLGPSQLDSAIQKSKERKFTKNETGTKNELVQEKRKEKSVQDSQKICCDEDSLLHIPETMKETEEDNDGGNNDNIGPSCSKNEVRDPVCVPPRDVVSKVPQKQSSIDASNQDEKDISPPGNSNLINEVVDKEGGNSNVTRRANEDILEGDKVAPRLMEETMLAQKDENRNVKDHVAPRVRKRTMLNQDEKDISPPGNSNLINEVVGGEGGNSNVTRRVNEDIQEGDKVAPRLMEETMLAQQDENRNVKDHVAPRVRKRIRLVQEGVDSIMDNDYMDAAVIEKTMPLQEGTTLGKETISVPEADNANKNKPKPSLMERNHTARAFEWENDELSEQPSTRVHLPSPKRLAVSPLKKYIPKKVTVRRRIKRWSVEEETALFKAVKKFGTGNWTLILNAYPDTFEGRTAVDLKDKWRNMTKFGRVTE